MRLLTAVTALALVLVASALPSTEENVYVLTPSNFDEFVNGEEVLLVEFYAPWCGHCKKLAPEYAKAAGILKSDDPAVKLAKVDCDAHKDLCSRFGVSGYPTVKVFRSGTPSDYKGPRESAGIVSYMRKQAAPAVKELSDLKSLESWVADEPGLVLFGDSSDPSYSTFKTTANANRESLRFAVVNSEEAQTQYKAKKGDILFLQSKRYTQSPLETASHTFDGAKRDGSSLVNFAKDHYLPLAGEYTQDNSQFYTHAGKPVVKVFAEVDWAKNAKGANYILNRIRKVAKEYNGKLIFAVADKKAFGREADELGGSAFGINDASRGKFKGEGEATPDNLKKFADDYLAGKIEAYIKSEPIPEKNDEEVTTVVAKNFKDIVFDETKDVLLEVYAPWCGHCKSLEPKYKELAKRLVPNNKNLVIAKIDGTANDLPPNYQARGFPTIFFAPANNKENPLKYEGAREVDDFVKYLKKNAKNTVVDA